MLLLLAFCFCSYLHQISITQPSFVFEAVGLFSFPTRTLVYMCNTGLSAQINTEISLLLSNMYIECLQGGYSSFLTYVC